MALAHSSIRKTQPEPEPAGTLEDVVAVAKALADGVRVAVLRVLREESYGVLELCSILDLPQPALSHHLKVLHQAGLVAKRREGNSIFYRRAPAPGPAAAALIGAIDTAALSAAQLERIDAVHQARNRSSEAFFSDHADEFASQQARISEPGVYVASVLDIVDRLGLASDGGSSALEIGPGDGDLLRPLAARFASVVGVDNARAMLDRCAERLADLDNVRLRHEDVARLPARRRYQLVVAAMVLHHQSSPQAFFRHLARLLSRGGALIVVELCHHDQEWARAACGDLWLGFEATELATWAGNAGLAIGESQFLAQKNGFRIQIHTFHHH